jgi:galactose mutarotase-like enzyme
VLSAFRYLCRRQHLLIAHDVQHFQQNINTPMHTISNEHLSIQVTNKGAELQSIRSIQNNLQYLWSGDPAYWGKKSPVLFPIVGGLRNNNYHHQGNNYQLSRHGFAREMDFTLVKQDDTSISFSLTSNDQTREVYPFDFIFTITYTLNKNTLHITFSVENTGTEAMPFSVGAHPAFAVPLERHLSYEDYHLQFSETEQANRWPLSADGLIEKTSRPFLQNQNKLPLKKELFAKDAIVFKDLQSTSISIQSDQSSHGLTVSYEGFPYMGIWAAKGADFVCIEPWCGIADNVDATGELTSKEGIQIINPREIFERSYSITVF